MNFKPPVRTRIATKAISSTDPSSMSTGEFLEMHYFELHSSSADNNIDDVPLRVHMPYLWSIDIEHKEAPTDLGPATSAQIIHYAISGDGGHAATLSATDHYLYLDLWDLSYTINNSSAVTDVEKRQKRAPNNPTCSAGMSLPFSNSDKNGKPKPVDAAIAVSWSGVYLALFPSTQSSQMEKSVIYKYSASPSPQALKDNADTPPLTGSMWRCEGVPDVYGQGRFHITDTNNPQERNELFITCDGATVRIYEVHRAWNLMFAVPLNTDSLLFAGDPIISLQDKYFAWFRGEGEGQAFIWNIEANVLANVVTGSKGKGACLANFSSDGSMIAISRGGTTITTYWTESGISIGTYELPFQTYASGLTFIRGDSQILVDWSSGRDWSQGTFGYILDSATMLCLDKFSNPGRYACGIQHGGVGPPGLYSCHGSTLNLIELEDYLFDPHSPTVCRCSQDNWDDFSAPSEDITFAAPSGLLFACNFIQPSDKAVGDTHSFSLEVSGNGSRRELIRFPSFALTELRPYKCYYKTAHFLEGLSQLLLYSDEVVMVLGLPETLDAECNILQAYWLQDKTFRHGNDHALQLREETGLQCCKHQKQLLVELYHYDISDQSVIVQVSLDRPTDGNQGFMFVNAIMALIEIYKVAESPCKQAIIRYLGLHINTYLKPSNLLECVIGKIIEAWKPTDHEICEELLASLLASENTRWVPRPDYTQKDNPLYVLLEKSRQAPLAMGLANIITQYCLRKGEEEEDYHFMSPLVSCLPELCDDSRLHQEMALDILHRMAYVPVKRSSYSYIIDNHIIAHPPEVRWQCWRSIERPLYKCDDPILQLTLSSKPHDSQMDFFVKRMFVAPFGMLWKINDEISARESHDIKGISWLGKSWLPTAASMIWYSCNPRRQMYVARHNTFSLSVFDNPALAALVEYKWNTIGYQYWLTRFLLQCVYYLLVLIVVFAQIYKAQEHLRLVYIAIIIFSGIFLWLEFIQFLHNSARYFISPYNLVDLAVFALPLAGSIRQIGVGPGVDLTLFSLSVLFVFLHLLFELRTIKSVCHYTTIIIQAIDKIRVFFFIFACGILAFSIAILHMLHGCSMSKCTPDPGFPEQPFYALSATYFFMTGRYDPVTDKLSQEDHWTFHLIMMIYVLFTVILMLNVLIALINTAFNAGDETWTQVWIENRLSYIESAENMLYHIEGFRRRNNRLPKAVYYTATPQQVTTYERTFKRKSETTQDDKRINDDLLDMSLVLREMKLALAINGISSTRSRLDDGNEGKDHNERVSRRFGAVTRFNDDIEGENSETLTSRVKELKLQLEKTQSHMDRRVDELQGQMNQIGDLLLTLSTSFGSR
ncbi:hypothetical protein BG004_004508 [Podila humilis]|nr:hypothetical protein BG004_004508 [Podila humilis]